MKINDVVTISSEPKDFKILYKSSETPVCDILEVKTNNQYKGFIEGMSTNGKLRVRITGEE
tara:strand:- start:533 stop:715 length:183 start_codon:yes stop_codon:yes gene_type:complete